MELVRFMNVSNDEGESCAKARGVTSSTLKHASKHKDGCISLEEGKRDLCRYRIGGLATLVRESCWQEPAGHQNPYIPRRCLSTTQRCSLGATTASDIVHSGIKMHQIRSLGPFHAQDL